MIAIYPCTVIGEKCVIGSYSQYHRCRAKAKYFVCVGDGKPRFSRWEASVCAKHLVKAVNVAVKRGHHKEKDIG